MDKKDYNKNYYETNKAKIAEKLYCKETCPHCQKVVSHQNMKSHQKTSYCKSRAYVDVRQQLVDLQNEINELKKQTKETETAKT
jgi:hypothetical protein